MREAPGVLRVSTIEEAREQAREALELVHTWRQREQAWDTPRALDFARIGASIRALLDATEPRPITDEMVEAAARVMFDAPDGMTGDYTWAEMVGEAPNRADLWRADARAALEAAEEARR